ncbi:hypothetical protein [Paenibacillus pinistramenti]|uniref:hypothetical protein n=1 Tax=Paenibacillus pinistramenti TaxID=1768003 RepID=UPI001107E58E|nr:hypothetical protein [Paenibacillus pinistramenti]
MGGVWRDSVFLLKKEMHTDWKYWFWNLFFMAYTAGCISLLVYSMNDSEAERSMGAVLDFMFLVMTPLSGIWFCRSSLRYLKEDSYTQKLFYFKILPIPLGSVVLSRIIQGLCALLINGVILYTLIYIFTDGLNGAVGLAVYLPFILTWAGYGLIINAYYIYFEFLSSGKVYLWMSFVHMGGCAVITAVVALYHGNVLLYTIEASERFGFLSPLMWGSLLLGGLVLVLTGRLVTRKIAARDMV